MSDDTDGRQFSCRFDELVATVLWFLKEGGGRLPLTKVHHLLFLTNYAMVERYATTICGGTYIANESGPTLSELQQFLDIKFKHLSTPFYLDENNVLWATASPDMDQFSEDGLQELSAIGKEWLDVPKGVLKKHVMGFNSWSIAHRELPCRTIPLEYFKYDMPDTWDSIAPIICEDLELDEYFT